FSSYADHRDLHSFPTRRSSDLNNILSLDNLLRLHSTDYQTGVAISNVSHHLTDFIYVKVNTPYVSVNLGRTSFYDEAKNFISSRSEEHTSELQSRENLVCRLLL